MCLEPLYAPVRGIGANTAIFSVVDAVRCLRRRRWRAELQSGFAFPCRGQALEVFD